MSLPSHYHREVRRGAGLNTYESELSQRAKLAYDAYTVAAGTHSPVPFISLWPRERAGWIAVAVALEPEEKRIP